MCLLAYNIILSVKCNENDTHCSVSRKYYAPCLLSIMAKRSINSSSRNCHNSLVVQRTESKSLAEFICNMKNITVYLNDIPISVNSNARRFLILMYHENCFMEKWTRPQHISELLDTGDLPSSFHLFYSLFIVYGDDYVMVVKSACLFNFC